MSPEHAKVIAGFLCQGLQNEFTVTQKVLAAVPNDKLDWRPHEKGRTAGELAWHIAAVDVWFLESILKGSFTMEGEPPAPKTVAEIVAFYEKNFPPALAKVQALSGEQLSKVLTFYVFNLPAVAYIGFCQNHSIHHRGQLAAYLRMVGAKVPSIYGGSADEPFAAAAS